MYSVIYKNLVVKSLSRILPSSELPHTNRIQITVFLVVFCSPSVCVTLGPVTHINDTNWTVVISVPAATWEVTVPYG